MPARSHASCGFMGALAYAADGRALTATMISAEPPSRSPSKSCFNPALLDTSLGLSRPLVSTASPTRSTGRDQYPERARAEGRFFKADPYALRDRACGHNRRSFPAYVGAGGSGLPARTRRPELTELIALDQLHTWERGTAKFSTCSVRRSRARTAPGPASLRSFQRRRRRHRRGPAWDRPKSPKDFCGPAPASAADNMSAREGLGPFYEKIGAVMLPVPTFQIWSGVRGGRRISPTRRFSFLKTARRQLAAIHGAGRVHVTPPTKNW